MNTGDDVVIGDRYRSFRPPGQTSTIQRKLVATTVITHTAAPSSGAQVGDLTSSGWIESAATPHLDSSLLQTEVIGHWSEVTRALGGSWGYKHRPPCIVVGPDGAALYGRTADGGILWMTFTEYASGEPVQVFANTIARVSVGVEF